MCANSKASTMAANLKATTMAAIFKVSTMAANLRASTLAASYKASTKAAVFEGVHQDSHLLPNGRSQAGGGPHVEYIRPDNRSSVVPDSN